jgi:hypothetical protein
VAEIHANHPDGDEAAINAFLERFYATPFARRKAMLEELKARNKAGTPALASDRGFSANSRGLGKPWGTVQE